MVMEQPKMSVGLESSALGINLSGPWLPSPSPTLKLNTPTLEALTGGTDWAVPNSSQPSGAQTGSLLSAPPAGVLSSAGLSPRFLFDNRLMSPGVSGSLAGNLQPDAPQAGSASLTELFNCSEYNIVPSPTQLTAQGTQAIVQQAVNPLIQKQISGAATDKTQSGRQTQQQAQSQAKQVQAPVKSEQQKQQAQKPPQPQQQAQQVKQQQQAQQQAKQAQAQQQRDAIQAQQTKPQQRQSQQQAQLPPASQHLQAQSMSMRSTSLPQSHALRTDAQRAQAVSHHAAFQAQSQALGAQQRPAPVPMLPTQARQEEPAHRQYSVYQSFDQQRHQPEMTARASAIPVPQGLHRAQLPVQAMHSQAMPTAMGYSHEMGHTYAQAHTDRLTMQAAHQGQSLGLTHAQVHAPSAPVIPSLGQSRLSGQAAFNLPPRPAATKGPRVELGTSISGAIEEAKVNAQQKANLFAQNRKRVRKEMEQDKKEDADDSKMSQTDIRKKRYNRRLELNRQSAAVSRVRRRAYVEELEEKLVTVEREKISLEGKVSEMHTENTTLREQLRALTEQISASARAPVPYPSLPRTDTGK